MNDVDVTVNQNQVDALNQNQVDALKDHLVPKKHLFFAGHVGLGKTSTLLALLLADNLLLFSTNVDARIESIETHLVNPTDALVRLDESIAGHQHLINDAIDELAKEDTPLEDASLPEGQRAVAFAESFLRRLRKKGVAGSIVQGQGTFSGSGSLYGAAQVIPAEQATTPQLSTAPVIETERSTRRINVNFSQSAYETLEQLAAQKGKSMSEVLRDAIQLEKWLTDAKAEGWHVLLEKSGRVRELVQI